MLEKLTCDTFAEHLNSQFRIQNGVANPITVELIEANEAGSSPRYEAFSIIFRGPSDTFLPQGIYPVDHDEIGTLELFIVPIRKDNDGLYYEACFNRLRSEERA
jgi:uncharacterized protein DUF6916